MKHIINQGLYAGGIEGEYHYIQSTAEEFKILRNFLKVYGVEVRLCMRDGDMCKWEVRNPYKVRMDLFHPDEAKTIEDSIELGYWRR